MSCDRTEYRLLLRAHGGLSWWERWQVDRHVRACPGCREQLERFRQERRVLSACLVMRPALRVADRVALELGVTRPPSGPNLVIGRRLSVLLVILAMVAAAGAAVGYVEWRDGTRVARPSMREIAAPCDEKSALPGSCPPANEPVPCPLIPTHPRIASPAGAPAGGQGTAVKRQLPAPMNGGASLRR
jgi:hypothetical protein